MPRRIIIWKPRKCRNCGRIIPFPVEEGKIYYQSSMNYCGFCVNPISLEWIEAYVKYLEKKLKNCEGRK